MADDSTSSAKGGSRRNPPDEPKWHPGRHLCYHWKREHEYLKNQVDEKNIAYNTEFDLNLQELETIEHSMLYRLKRLTTRRLTVKKDSSKKKIDVEAKHIQELLGKIHNQKEWWRPKNKVYISG
jgi:hypothetical protein